MPRALHLYMQVRPKCRGNPGNPEGVPSGRRANCRPLAGRARRGDRGRVHARMHPGRMATHPGFAHRGVYVIRVYMEGVHVGGGVGGEF